MSGAERDAIVQRATAIAATRGGVIDGPELVSLGLSRKQIRGKVRTGWLHDLDGDVFAVGHASLSPRAWLQAALLSGGIGAALSYWTAAVLWGLVDASPTPDEIEVSTPRSKRTGCRGTKIHTPRKLPGSDCTTRSGLRVTTLFRTLLDLATVATDKDLVGVVEAAHTIHGIDLLELAAFARRHPRKPGAAKLRDAARSVIGPARLRSTLERLFRDMARNADLPPFETNVPFEGQELDVLFRYRNAAIELNWWKYHGGRRSYRRDHRKARRLAALGVSLLPIAGEDLEDVPEEVLSAVEVWLARHPVVDEPLIPPTE